VLKFLGLGYSDDRLWILHSWNYDLTALLSST
jgi:hypothetical protein